MANFKKKKCRRQVKCQICTPHRGLGNSAGRVTPKEKALKKRAQQEIDESKD